MRNALFKSVIKYWSCFMLMIVVTMKRKWGKFRCKFKTLRFCKFWI